MPMLPACPLVNGRLLAAALEQLPFLTPPPPPPTPSTHLCHQPHRLHQPLVCERCLDVRQPVDSRAHALLHPLALVAGQQVCQVSQCSGGQLLVLYTCMEGAGVGGGVRGGREGKAGGVLLRWRDTTCRHSTVRGCGAGMAWPSLSYTSVPSPLSCTAPFINTLGWVPSNHRRSSKAVTTTTCCAAPC
jgi:hypothetical protein